MRFKKSLLATALLSVLALSGCNSDTATAKTTTIKAIDGYLVNARVSVDTDGKNGCDTDIGYTHQGGEYNLPIKYKDNAICITAIPNKTIDETRGVVKKEYQLTAPGGSPVVTPITQLLVEQMEQQKKDGEEPSLEGAKKIVAKLFESVQDQSDLFGDFLTNTTTNTTIIKVATALVDAQQSNINININDNKFEIKGLVDNTSQLDQRDLENHEDRIFQPIITQSGEVIRVQKPTINVDALKEIQSQSINVNDQIHPINLNDIFSINSGYLTYTESELPAGLSINKDNILSGSVSKAGTFTVYINAVHNGVGSDAIKFTFTVKTPNAVPTVIKDGQKELQELTNQLDLTQGDQIDDVTYPVSSLFNDADSDSLVVKAEFTATGNNTSNGITVTQKDDQLILSGTPINKSEMTLTLSANDGVNTTSADATIKLNIAEGVKPEPVPVVPEPTKPLAVTPANISKTVVGKTWFVTSLNTSVNEGSDIDSITFTDQEHLTFTGKSGTSNKTPFSIDNNNNIKITSTDDGIDADTQKILYVSPDLIISTMNMADEPHDLIVWSTKDLNAEQSLPVTDSQFIGKTWYMLTDESDDSIAKPTILSYKFNKDDSLIAKEPFDSTNYSTGSWSIDNNDVLTTINDDEGNHTFTNTVIEQSSDYMVIKETSTDYSGVNYEVLFNNKTRPMDILKQWENVASHNDNTPIAAQTVTTNVNVAGHKDITTLSIDVTKNNAENPDVNLSITTIKNGQVTYSKSLFKDGTYYVMGYKPQAGREVYAYGPLKVSVINGRVQDLDFTHAPVVHATSYTND